MRISRFQTGLTQVETSRYILFNISLVAGLNCWVEPQPEICILIGPHYYITPLHRGRRSVAMSVNVTFPCSKAVWRTSISQSNRADNLQTDLLVNAFRWLTPIVVDWSRYILTTDWRYGASQCLLLLHCFSKNHPNYFYLPRNINSHVSYMKRLVTSVMSNFLVFWDYFSYPKL